jgi:hypothetical protein
LPGSEVVGVDRPQQLVALDAVVEGVDQRVERRLAPDDVVDLVRFERGSHHKARS